MIVISYDYFNDFDVEYGKYVDKTKDTFYLNCIVKIKQTKTI